MRRTYTYLLTAAVMFAATAFSTAAFAQAAATPGGGATGSAPVGSATKLGIINVQRVIVECNEGQREFDTLNKKFEPKQTQLQTQSKELDALKKQMNDQGPKMNDEARNTLAKDIDTRQRNLQRDGEDAQNDFNSQQAELAQKLLTKIGPVIDKFAKDNGYSVLIDDSNPWPQGQVLWAMPASDVTGAVITAYNASSGVAAPAASAPSATRPSAPAATRPAGNTGAATHPATRPNPPQTKP